MMDISLPAERQGQALPPQLAVLRSQLAAGISAGTWNTLHPCREEVLGGRRALRFQPRTERRGYLLHLHGGAFRLGAPEMAGPFAAALAERCAIEVILPEYRLAPEHPFPAGLQDAFKCLQALHDEAGKLPLIVAGDSAGGGLAASATLLAAANTIRVDGLVLLSPWLDLTVTAPTYRTNAESDPLFSEQAAAAAAGLYLQGASPRHPLASPLFAPAELFPPTLINVGLGEVLVNDALSLYGKLEAMGVESVLSAVEGMEHTAVVRNKSLVGSSESLEEICKFIERRLSLQSISKE